MCVSLSFPQGPAGLKGGEGPQGPPGPVVSILLADTKAPLFPLSVGFLSDILYFICVID